MNKKPAGVPAPLTRPQRLAVAIKARWEQFREYAYPDPYSPLARATRGARWGFVPASAILARLKPEVRALSGDPWTVGFGETQGVTSESKRSLEVAEQRLGARAVAGEKIVRELCRLDLVDHELAALIAFGDNVGYDVDADVKPEGLGDSRLLRYLNTAADQLARAKALEAEADGLSKAGAKEAKADCLEQLDATIAQLRADADKAREIAKLNRQLAANEFANWRFARGKPSAGLRNRRLDERLMFLGRHPMIARVA